MILSRDGWIKRQREVKDLGDDAPARGRQRARRGRRARPRRRSRSSRTSAPATSCASTTCRATTGYGEPVQKLFKLGDGERIVAHAVASIRACSTCPRPSEGAEEPRAAVRAGGDARRARASASRCARTASRRRARAAASRALERGRRGRLRRRRRRRRDSVLVRQRATATRSACTVDEVALLAGAGQGRRC